MRTEEFEAPYRAILDHMLDAGATCYESLRAHMRKPWNARPLEIHIVDDPRLNAVATSCDGTFLIHVFRGAVERIYGTMYGLLSCPTFLSTIGDARREARPEHMTGSGFPPFPLLRVTGPPPTSTDLVIPQDPLRQTVAMHLATVALEFLLYHEIGHIVAGHLEIRSARGLDASISERHNALGQDQASELLRVLECDADAFAGHMCWGVETDEEMANAIRDIVNAGGSVREHIASITCLVAVGALFRTLYPSAPLRIGSSKSSHPHPALRACVVCCCAVARAMHGGRLTAEHCDAFLGYTVRSVEDTWADLCLGGSSPEPPSQWAQSVQNGVSDLLDSHASKRSLLEQYSHLPRRWHDWEWPTPPQSACTPVTK